MFTYLIYNKRKLTGCIVTHRSITYAEIRDSFTAPFTRVVVETESQPRVEYRA